MYSTALVPVFRISDLICHADHVKEDVYVNEAELDNVVRYAFRATWLYHQTSLIVIVNARMLQENMVLLIL